MPIPRIPQRIPVLCFVAEAPRPWSGFLELPVVAQGAVLLAGDEPCLAALDAATGQPRFVVSWPAEGAEAYAGLPLPLDGGRVLVPVYHKDAALRVIAIGPDGEVEAVDDLGADAEQVGVDLEIVAHDLGCKLFLLPLARGIGGDYLVSWTYRQVRFYWTECRRLGGGLRWSAPEAMLADTDDVVLGATRPPRGAGGAGAAGHAGPAGAAVDPTDHSALVARDKRSGAVLWSVPAQHRAVAGAGEGSFFVLDLSARAAEIAARAAAWDEEMLRALEADPALDEVGIEPMERSFAAQRPVRAASRLTALDARTGRAIWEQDIPGDVCSIGGPGGGLLAAVAAEGSEVRLYRYDAATGAARGWSPLGSSWPAPPTAASCGASPLGMDLWSAKLPAIVGVDGQAIAWASPEELVAERAEPPFDRLWRWPLPAPCRAFRPRTADRHLNAAAISVGDGRIYLRDGARLWAIGAPDEAIYKAGPGFAAP
ncbi:PQQ-binding-like beta-propeller repeat protein [Sorangium sp. So ce269]